MKPNYFDFRDYFGQSYCKNVENFFLSKLKPTQWTHYASTVYKCTLRRSASAVNINPISCSFFCLDALAFCNTLGGETQQCKWQERVICTSQPPLAWCTQTARNYILLRVCNKVLPQNTSWAFALVKQAGARHRVVLRSFPWPLTLRIFLGDHWCIGSQTVSDAPPFVSPLILDVKKHAIYVYLQN